MTTVYRLKNRWEVIHATPKSVKGYRCTSMDRALSVALRWAKGGKVEVILCA